MICSKCHGDFPATAQFFSPIKRGRNGLDYQCRECKRAAARRYKQGYRAPEKQHARRVAYDMYADEFVDCCLKNFGTDHPCPYKATWQALSHYSEWRACDEHRLKTDVRIPVAHATDD